MMVRLTREEIQMRADAVGYSELVYNPFIGILKECDHFEKQGLTPIVLAHPETGRHMITTSEQMMERKFH